MYFSSKKKAGYTANRYEIKFKIRTKMTTKQKNNQIRRYETPKIDALNVEMAQNILNGSGTTPTLPDYPGEDW